MKGREHIHYKDRLEQMTSRAFFQSQPLCDRTNFSSFCSRWLYLTPSTISPIAALHYHKGHTEVQHKGDLNFSTFAPRRRLPNLWHASSFPEDHK